MTTFTLDTLPKEMAGLVSELKKRKINVVLFDGDLGRGKTTSIQEIARSLGVTESVLSPTFVLMKQYQTSDEYFTTLIHIDAYRITDGSLFRLLGLDAVIADPHTLVCVEWPNLIPELGHYPHALVHLEYENETTRTIGVSFT